MTINGDELEPQPAPLTRFMGLKPLTETLAALECDLDGCTAENVSQLLQNRGVSADLLRAALLAREKFGRINDLIHATAITVALPHLLRPGEVLRCPSPEFRR